MRNIGNEGMFWHIYATTDIDWLEIRKEMGENGFRYARASTQEQLLSGAMLAQDIAKIELRVVGIAD